MIARLCLPLIEKDNDLLQTALACRLFFQLLEKKMAIYWIVAHKHEITHLEERIEWEKHEIEVELKREFERLFFPMPMVNGYDVFAEIKINEMQATGVYTYERHRARKKWNQLSDDDKKVFIQMAVEQNQEELNRPVLEEELLAFESRKQETIERLTSWMSEKEALLLELRPKFDYRMRLLTG